MAAAFDVDYEFTKAILRACGISSEGVVSVVFEARYPDIPTLTVTRYLPDTDTRELTTDTYQVSRIEVPA